MKLAMTQNFAWIPTEEESSEYLRYKEKETLEEWNFKVFFTSTMFHWYHWITLAFQTDWIYDKYRVYEKWKLIVETEDEVCELPFWIVPSDLSVVAFERVWDEYISRAMGLGTIETPDRNKTKNYKLSVVVPLYNSELFMCRTIDSILSSSLDSIELILIDDGSLDNSREIAQRYANNYKCVKAYHQENQWVSFARNRWLELCKWEFMAFCDNDDIPHPFMYENLYKACKKEGTDIAICPALIRKDIEENEPYLTAKAKTEDVFTYDFEEMYKNRGTTGNIFWVAVWNKIVKTDVAKLAKFPTDYTWPWILYEDVAYTSTLYSYIERFTYCRDAIYTRDKRKQKTVGTASTRHTKYDNEYVRKMFIYGFSWALYHKSGKHTEWHDYTHFKRLIESYDKFDSPSPLRTYWDEKLKELVESQKLNENELIMKDGHLAEIVSRFI